MKNTELRKNTVICNYAMQFSMMWGFGAAKKPQLQGWSMEERNELMVQWAEEFLHSRETNDARFFCQKLDRLLRSYKLFVDMDGCLCEWRAAAEYEDLFKKGYFATLKPNANVLRAIEKIIHNDEAEVYILSAYLPQSRFALQEKNLWVDRYLPEIDDKHRIFCPVSQDKVTAAQRRTGGFGKTHVLLDDYSQNLHHWEENGGVAVKVMNGVNGTKGSWRGRKITTYMSPEEISERLLRASGQ